MVADVSYEDAIRAGDLVTIYSTTAYGNMHNIREGLGIAIGDSTVFTGNSVYKDVFFLKTYIECQKQINLEKKLQKQYIDFLHNSLKFDVDKIAPGDVFVRDESEYVYLGSRKTDENDVEHQYLELMILGLNLRSHRIFHNRMKEGKMEKSYLTKFLKKQGIVLYRKELLRNAYFIGHYDLPLETKVLDEIQRKKKMK